MQSWQVAAVLMALSVTTTARADLDIPHLIQFAQQRLTAVNPPDGSSFPIYNDGPNWVWVSKYDWTAGYYPGLLWLMYEQTGDDQWKALAQDWTARLADVQWDATSSVTGLVIFTSYGNGYRLTGDPTYAPVILQAETTVASRFNPIVGCIDSWDWGAPNNFLVVVDDSMTHEGMYWAAGSGDPQYQYLYDMAVSEARVIETNNLRPDGSTWHGVDYDPNTGQIIRKLTIQGYSDNSTWSRGQAWAIYGFTMHYRETGLPEFLSTAQTVADYYLSRLPDDFVPYWDFDHPDIPDTFRDTSAAAIAASGLLELRKYVSDPAASERYRTAAVTMLTSLSAPPYLSEGTDNPGILAHATYSIPEGYPPDTALIFGDYFFLKALLQYQQL